MMSGIVPKRRRKRKQDEYVGPFRQAVIDFLAPAPAYTDLAEKLADAVTRHATPVGSGTVARTERIPIRERAEADCPLHRALSENFRPGRE